MRTIKNIQNLFALTLLLCGLSSCGGKSSVETRLIDYGQIHYGTYRYNQRATNFRTVKQNGLTISFDWKEGDDRVQDFYPLLVALYDKNGACLTQFTTKTRFSANYTIVESCAKQQYERPVVLLKPKGNTVAAAVPERDVRDATSCKVTFVVDNDAQVMEHAKEAFEKQQK